METTVASNVANYLSSLTAATLREWGIDGDSLIRSLHDQLENGHRHDEMLITAIADALMDSLSRNVMSGSTLQALRNAVLIPSERAKVAQLIRNGEMGCANCGRDFVTDEMVILSKRAPEPNATSRYLLFCTRCMVPRWISCTKGSCKGKAEFPKTAFKLLTGAKSICHDHGEKQADPSAPETPQPVGIDFPSLDPEPMGPANDAVQVLNRLRRNAGIPIPAGNIVQSRWGAAPRPVEPPDPVAWTTSAPTVIGNLATQEAYQRIMRESELRAADAREDFMDEEEPF